MGLQAGRRTLTISCSSSAASEPSPRSCSVPRPARRTSPPGVFRDLVVTGRPRKTLFNVRYPGALIVFLPMLATAFGIALVCSYAFADGVKTPSAATVGHYAAYLFGVTMVNIAVALGLAAFTSSRVVVGVLIAWVSIVAPLLQSITSLGSIRQLSYVAAATSLLPAAADVGTRRPHERHDRDRRLHRLGSDLSPRRTLADRTDVSLKRGATAQGAAAARRAPI